MYELSIAWRYLIPRWKQLSVSIISLISICVIATVVWLILVFFSVTEGLEEGWMRKLTALTAPIRITPNGEYYNSYYYLIDSISEGADYSSRSIGEKLLAKSIDSYNPTVDAEIPLDWPAPETGSEGERLDLVKEAFEAVKAVRNALELAPYELVASDYEMATSNVRLRMVRGGQQRFLSQASYLGSFDADNAQLRSCSLSLTLDDLNNMLRMTTMTPGNLQSNSQDPLIPIPSDQLQERLHAFFDNVAISALEVKAHRWSIPRHLLPTQARWKAFASMQNGRIGQIFLAQDRKQTKWLEEQLLDQGWQIQAGVLSIQENSEEGIQFFFENNASGTVGPRVPILAFGRLQMLAELVDESVDSARRLEEVRFQVQLSIQQSVLTGEIPFDGLILARARPVEYFASAPSLPPPWLHYLAREEQPLLPSLPKDLVVGDGILVAKQFRDSGVLLGDRGYLSYYSPTTSSVQEQRVPVYVAGFYDPGIIPIGGKFITVDKSITSVVRASQHQEESGYSNGISVRFPNLENAQKIKKLLEKEFRQRDIDKYWQIETFREFDFTREIAQQLQSERNLFSLISMIIIVVACSNIISMLIILVNDKRLEIGILRSMGSSASSIATIFGLSGVVMGAAGGLLGTLAAAVTMRYIDNLLALLGRIQGFDVLNKSFYGELLSPHLSLGALTFVLVATVIISLLAGVVPAIKAASMRPAEIMRKE